MRFVTNYLDTAHWYNFQRPPPDDLGVTHPFKIVPTCGATVNLLDLIIFLQDRVCEIILPRLQKRSVLEENGQLKPRWSALEEDLEAIVAEEEANKIVSASQKSRMQHFYATFFMQLIQSAELNTGDGYESPVPSPPRKEKKKKEKKDKKDKKEKKKKKYKDLDAPDGSRR